MDEYNKLENIESVISNVGNKLIQNQNLLKCIAYDDSNALLLDDISPSKIKDIVGKGNKPKEQQRIFKYPFNNKIIDTPRSELRFFIPNIVPENDFLSDVNIAFEIIIYHSLWDLDSNKIRPFVILKELLSDFNGYDIESIGELYLASSIKIINWNDKFSGYTFAMKTRTR